MLLENIYCFNIHLFTFKKKKNSLNLKIGWIDMYLSSKVFDYLRSLLPCWNPRAFQITEDMLTTSALVEKPWADSSRDQLHESSSLCLPMIVICLEEGKRKTKAMWKITFAPPILMPSLLALSGRGQDMLELALAILGKVFIIRNDKKIQRW